MSTPSPAFRTLPDGLSRRHPNILTVAHRGVWSTAPENSIGAIEAAIQLGVEMVELDTQSTVDGLLVHMHDETLDRTTTGTGPVETIAYDHLRRLRLRGSRVEPKHLPWTCPFRALPRRWSPGGRT